MGFQQLIQILHDERDVIVGAPFLSFVLVGLGSILGYAVAKWYLTGRLTEKEGLLARYRVALGLVPGSRGVLIELTNEEMRAKATTTAAALRDFEIGMRNETQSAVSGARNEADKAERAMRILRDSSDEFDRKLKADAVSVDTELRRRLGPQALASSVGLPPTFYTASDRAPIGITSLMPSGMGMSAGFAGTFADGIEQMARLLPIEAKRFRPRLR
jgi:hypothetical protein